MAIDVLKYGLPANIDAEKFLLGSILLDDGVFLEIASALEAGDFCLEKHQRIFRRMAEIHERGEKVDRITLANELVRYEELESVDGLSYIVSLDDGLPKIPNLDGYIRIIQDKAILRRIIALSVNFQERCIRAENSPQEILDSLSKSLLDLTPPKFDGGLQGVRELLDEVGFNQLLAPRKEKGLMFPWEWMNEATCGMLPGELWVLAGHTSTGKTSAAIQMGVNRARKGTGVAVFSLEVGKPSLFTKAVYQVARVDAEKAKRGQLNQEERQKVTEAATEIYSLPFYFDTSSTTTTAIRTAIRRRKQSDPVDLVIVDYLQLLGNTNRFDNRAQAVGANAWALKLMANEFQVPVLLLSQFSRESAKPGARRKPELSDLKESGDIENHANGVWFIHRENLEDADQIPVQFILAKQRDGRRNIWSDFFFFPRFQRFDGATEA